MSPSQAIARRRFLRETFAFSALALTGVSRTSFAQDVETRGSHLLMVGDWGATGRAAQQTRVASAMRRFVESNRLKTEAMLMLGDNFYGQFDGGVESPRWKTQFEEMYPKSAFDCPCYALLGNHDYYIEPADKPDAQLAYARKGGTRWTMPAKWYRFDFPQLNPIVTFIALDSNYQKTAEGKQALNEQERAAQRDWLEAELAKPRRTPFLVVLGHHPLYSNGSHGDSATLIGLWDSLFRQHKVHMYLCGHDHDLQHLEFAGHPTSFVISGGGGAGLRELKIDPAQRGPFGRKAAGFSHLQVTPEQLVLRHIDEQGTIIHGFSKTPEGIVRSIGSA
jgi:tartrate-resistant acid phosphatase type 5